MKELDAIDFKISRIKANLDSAIKQREIFIKTINKTLNKHKSPIEIDGGLPWVININNNTYYQVVDWDNVNLKIVTLTRNGELSNTTIDFYRNNFRGATQPEREQHIKFLLSKGMRVNLSKSDAIEETKKPEFDTENCEFYMTTVTGQYGSKVRHTSYCVAIKEAKRLALQMNHKVWVTGVIAVVEPIIDVKVTTK